MISNSTRWTAWPNRTLRPKEDEMKNWSMKKIFVLVAVAVCAVAVIRVLGQPLVSVDAKLTPISKGVTGTLHPTAGELVIDNDTDYANFFGGTPPATPTVNFAAQDVLAVTLGDQLLGSSVSIPLVQVRTTGLTAGWGTVHVDVTIGSGSATVQPFAVVAVPKGALLYNFVQDVPSPPYFGPAPFNQIIYNIGGGIAPYHEQVTIENSGGVTINRSTIIGSTGGTSGTTYSGSLTPAERQVLWQTLANANPATLPQTVPGGSTTTGLPSETISSIIGNHTYATTMVQAGFYGDRVQVLRLVNALRRPTERIVRETHGQSLNGRISLQDGTLHIGWHAINGGDPFAKLLAANEGKHVEIEALHDSGPTDSVLSIEGKLTGGDSLVTFPSPGADVLSWLPAGTPVHVTGLTLLGTYVEVKAEDHRGFVHSNLMAIGEIIGPSED